METSRAQSSRHAGASPASRTFPGGLSAAQQDSESCPRWFESSPGSNAAAHGCGPAFVQRVTRVGTGWRLWALIAQWPEALESRRRYIAAARSRGPAPVKPEIRGSTGGRLALESEVIGSLPGLDPGRHGSSP
jgi:hypothetical protein